MHILPHVAAGGATLAAMELARGLNPDRWDVTMVVGPGSGGEGNVLEEMRGLGLEVILIPEMCRAPDLRRDARALRQLAEVLYHERPHVIHTHGSKPKMLAPIATTAAQVPVRVAHIWGWEWAPARGTARKWACEWEARMTAPGSDALIACSEAMRQQGLERGVGDPRQYEVVLPSVDLARFNTNDRERARSDVRSEFGLPLDAPVVISVMRLARQKAPEVLLGAAALLSALLPKVRWLIVGGGPQEDEVREAVVRIGLGDRVVLSGPRRDIPRLMKGCDIFAMASRWEPFGIVFLEAAAVGLPTVGTRVDGVPEAVMDGETGLLVPPESPTHLATSIAKLVTDRELARRLGMAGMRRTQQFGHGRFVREVEAIYERLLSEKTRAG
jgi:glycosyltransferase involved in cell wall biosynthesis